MIVILRLFIAVLFAMCQASAAPFFEDSKNSSIPNIPVKRSYVCPPNFVRLSHKCYFFSREKASWQNAYFQCRDLRSNLAIIKTPNQDRLIRKTLSKKTLVPSERWIGGVYDWEQMQWKWAASGKPLTYKGFEQYENQDKSNLRWHCIVVDPALQYKWNARSCYEEKHFICHTKIKIITNNKDKKKLLRQYKVNKLNEIPIPDIQGDKYYKDQPIRSNSTVENLTKHVPISVQFEINNDLNAQFAQYPQTQVKKRKNKNRRNKNKRKQQQLTTIISNNGTNRGVYDAPKVHNSYYNGPAEPSVVTLGENFNRRRRNRVKADEIVKENERPIEHMKWKTYRKEANSTNPLYPRPIVEEYNFIKDS